MWPRLQPRKIHAVKSNASSAEATEGET